jgi:hypothetical protein
MLAGHSTSAAALLLCPHCSTPLGDVHPAGPTRCGACRLLVAPGRAVPARRTEDASGVGVASGALANVARRAGVPPVDPELVTAALRRAADQLGIRVDGLRLIDYRRTLEQGGAGPTLAEVMATFGTWTTARDAARER